MHRMKRVFAIVLLAMVVGMGTPAAFAEGNTEAPGMGTERTVDTLDTFDSDAQSEGYMGNVEAPGYIDMALIYLGVII